MNKLFKFFYTCLALCGIVATVTSCSDDDDPTYLSEVRVSQSLIAFTPGGGDVTISLNAADSWTIASDDKAGMPDWLTISPESGSAGTQDVTFKATAASETRTANLFIECAGKKQSLTIQQVTEKQDLPIVPIKTVNEGPEGNYRVKGVCVADPDNQYGNWYIEDETGRVQVYGTLDKKGGKGTYPISGTNGWGFGIGDIITIEGPVTTYKDAKEFVDVTIIAIEKSLIKVDSFDVATLPIEGGLTTAAVTSKGNGISVDIPDEAKSWLSVAGIDTNKGTVKFYAAPNDGGDRATTIVFKTTDNSGKEYTAEAALSQKGSIQEVTISDFLAAPVGDAQFRVTGVVTQLYTSDKQGESFYISDFSGQTLVYRAAGFKDSGAKVGDVVTVVGKRGAYKDTPQMVNGVFEGIKYSVETLTIEQFRAVEDNKEKYYLISGEVVEATEEGTKNDLEQYGNFNLTDETGSVYVYGVTRGWGDSKGHFGDLGVALHDKLTILAYKTTYKGLVEAVGMYFSHVPANGAE